MGKDLLNYRPLLLKLRRKPEKRRNVKKQKKENLTKKQERFINNMERKIGDLLLDFWSSMVLLLMRLETTPS